MAYNGPDTVYYYKLREKRGDRERERQGGREAIRKHTEDSREEEAKKQQQGRLAYNALEISLSSGATSQLGPMDSQFDLYCRKQLQALGRMFPATRADSMNDAR
jgi:hypothetical protein